MFEEMARKELLYENNGNLSIKMHVVDHQIGVELVLKVLKTIYLAVTRTVVGLPG